MIRWWSTRCFLATWVTFEVQSDSRDVKRDLSLATWVPDLTEPPSDLWATILIIECVYSFYFLKFSSLLFTQIILHPTEETSLDSEFAQRSYDHLTHGGSNLTWWPSKEFWLRIGSKLLDFSARMIRWRSILCFLATWVIYKAQSDSHDVRWDLSLATWIPDPTEPHSDLWATTLIIECVYLFYFPKFASLVFTQVIPHPTEETSLDSEFARRSCDHLTHGGSNLTW
jgi:hypothetical protein